MTRAARRAGRITKEDTIPAQAIEAPSTDVGSEESAESLLEQIEATREVELIEFELGDNVVYPHHGAGKVEGKEEMEMLGETREYLTIKILHNDMTVRCRAKTRRSPVCAG